MGFWSGLDAIVVGGAYLVALLTINLLLRPFAVAILSKAPLIGGWLSSNVDSGLADFARAITPASAAALPALTALLEWLTDSAWGLVGAIVSGIEAGPQGLVHLATLTIPAAIHGAEQYAAGLVQTARADLGALVAAAESQAAAGLNHLDAALTALIAAERSFASGLFSTVEADLTLEVDRLDGILTAGLVEVRNAAAAGINEAEALAQDLADKERQAMLAAVTLVEGDLQKLAAAERVLLEDSITALGGDLTASAAQSRADLNAVESELQKGIDAILESLPWKSLLAGVEVAEEVIKADVRALVLASAVEIRKAMGDAEAIRAKYGPQVRAALAQIRAA